MAEQLAFLEESSLENDFNVRTPSVRSDIVRLRNGYLSVREIFKLEEPRT